jgi:hypothetical protein
MSEFHACLDDSKFVYDVGYILLSFVYSSVTVEFNEKCKCKIHYKSVLS